MARFSAAEIAQAVGGELVAHKKAEVNGVVTDSRNISRGSLFVAIKGPNHDGHRFVRDAFAKGAAVALISEHSLMLTEPYGVFVVVEDTVTALQELAAYHRSRFKKLLVVGVTGSSGKTTVKNMTAAALSRRYVTLKTEGNLNNHIGVPMTLLNLTRKHEAAVIEMGMSSAGEIARLARIAAPSIGVITNIGSAHLGGLGSVAAVRKAKGELLDEMTRRGKAVLNIDDPNSEPLIKKTPLNTVTFGWGDGADARVMESRLAPSGRRVTIRWKKKENYAKLKLIGVRDADNASAAFAVAGAAGVEAGEIVKGLGSVKPEKMRMEPVRLANGALLINDAYNANPDSVKSAIQTLVEIGGGGRTIFVFGDMLELGPEEEAIHARIGKFAGKSGVNAFYSYGPLAGRSAKEAGLVAGCNAKAGKNKERLADEIAGQLRPGDVALVKGSRGMRMEDVVDRIISIAGRR
ncbi:MAG: UDP-N-acetylmuramoyl-tripeptide--D-alanyl-D-alanine ligase [Nitrospinae bacterium]|nr:UDP-N-acetylmuramoyl-tripeptide--D-alanyl-D-alanine ligase [Nitrospinota bacterium]MBF0635113.1 UDP-N-acetylmuramoyl-tripeptide--D-alanyl-D-alanine ligase [Nitrospinota bacterium]